MLCCLRPRTRDSSEEKPSPAVPRSSAVSEALAEDMRQWEAAQTRLNDFLRRRRSATSAASQSEAADDGEGEARRNLRATVYADIDKKALDEPGTASTGRRCASAEAAGDPGETATLAVRGDRKSGGDVVYADIVGVVRN
ncbi:hypothetical protein BOX15_Mlig027108g1 [Macrostomum lignano]|uniref:Uncharacterized protein n=1 Tax=Macrostomum lignano TaxID=282301 RepID=A0A267G1M2_9PLAT|nr:hypothetical protein BOX15_Mlig027108g1 [Macrostomum lignano]